jgi:hypothetical protein
VRPLGSAVKEKGRKNLNNIYIYLRVIYEVHLKKKLAAGYPLNIALYAAETWTLWTVDHTYLESFQK